MATRARFCYLFFCFIRVVSAPRRQVLPPYNSGTILQVVQTLTKLFQILGADEWIALPPMGTGRAFVCACVVDNKVYVVGGHDGKRVLKVRATCNMHNSKHHEVQ